MNSTRHRQIYAPSTCLVVFVEGSMTSPPSREYKKAHRLHSKSTKNRPAADHEWSTFRAAEKKYKARFPPPDLSVLLDLANGNPRLYQPIRISAKGSDVFILPDVPGDVRDDRHFSILTCPTPRTSPLARIHLSARSTSFRQMVTSRPCPPSKRDESRRTLCHPTRGHLERPPPISHRKL